MDQLVDVWI